MLRELDFNQWNNTDDVIWWFRHIPQKSDCKFIQLDIREFYSSITEKTLINAIAFTEKYISISKQDIWIIKHCTKSLLLYENEAWKKKDIDVTTGSHDAVELCELVGIYFPLSKYTFKRWYGFIQRQWIIYPS